MPWSSAELAKRQAAHDYNEYETRYRVLRRPPKQDDPFALQEWYVGVLGIWIPSYPVCPGHCSPYDYFFDRYYNIVLNSVLWASRFGSKSFMAALEAWGKGHKWPGWEANIVAGSQYQAGMIYEAMGMMWRASEDIGSREVLEKEPLQSVTKYKGGGRIYVSTSSSKAARGPHPNALFADEIDEMPPDVLNDCMNQTCEKGGYPASTAMLSTMHKTSGLMQDWVDNAKVRGYKLYKYCILETMAACVDHRCSTCYLDKWCEGRMKPAIKKALADQKRRGLIDRNDKVPVMGYNGVEFVIQKAKQGATTVTIAGQQYQKLIDVDAELFGRRPTKQGLVIKDFNEDIHVIPAGEISIQPDWMQYGAIDWGYTNPFVYLFVTKTASDQFIIWKEYVVTETEPEIAADEVKAMADGVGVRPSYVVADPEDPGAIKTWARKTTWRMVRHTDGAPAELVGLAERVKMMRRIFELRATGDPQVLISSACPYFLKEVMSWGYPKTGQSELPEDKNNHAMMAFSYFLAYWRMHNMSAAELANQIRAGGRRSETISSPAAEAHRADKEAIRQIRRQSSETRRRPRRSSGRDFGGEGTF